MMRALVLAGLMAALAIVVAATVFWLWSVQQTNRAERRADEKNPIDIES